ncbi:MmcQ/YjbR family DNA-binding protein [Ruminiclostridium herbifermentans]|uniref:MmcQ/YjbR family DNA-binding protein n=1 Tax=Ruminiclostridium herbifermentans TaxID=2488810 RepID=A0A4U7JH69_9FIRM|nr:MmcQ/YjbR family DNA-binding protein [Ruminiclostridium herbifermentans]QNU66027.1 MmcQ/YjbR family DNA-binding protein [Ruminiclostridium herbifermentans]
MKYLWLDEYLLSMKGATKDFKVEWGWTRYLIGNKMFAAICKDAKGERDIITIKLEPFEGEFLRSQHQDIIPGHYMNKEHWNSIYLDWNIPDEMMKDLTKKSYQLVLGGLSKKLQKEILGLF